MYFSFSVYLCQRETERKSDRQMSALPVVPMQQSTDKRAGIIGDNHSFIPSLPITLGRGLR